MTNDYEPEPPVHNVRAEGDSYTAIAERRAQYLIMRDIHYPTRYSVGDVLSVDETQHFKLTGARLVCQITRIETVQLAPTPGQLVDLVLGLRLERN